MLSRLDHEIILTMYERGDTQAVISRTFKISRSRIQQILTGYKLIPNKLKEEFKKKLAKKCFFCEKPRQHIHHIDHNSSNNILENLMPLCITHHGQIHRGTRLKKIIDFAKRRQELKRRPIQTCLYCRKEFFPIEGREKLQKYHHPNCRKNDYRRRKRLARVSSPITL